jgi:1-acyl-sn-glycerol-3-phosphate acyltransferase
MKFLQAIFFVLIVRPLIMIVIGLNIQGKEHLPIQGPAIIAANHNSHLDTLVLLSLWPLSKLSQVRPIAAADYFLSNKLLAWFSLNIMNIIPIERQRKDRTADPLIPLSEALQRGEILILFPEGSRGAPEEMGRFRTGISRLVERNPEAPIVPIFMHGLGKALPKGEFLLVPFFCDVIIGELLYWRGSVEATMQAYEATMNELAHQHDLPAWE